jgi:hypothetical protein
MGSAIDFSDFSDLIPDKTTSVVQLKIKYGDGTDGVLSRSKSGETEGLNVELTLLEGPYAKRKFFAWLLLFGSTEGQKSMADRNKVLLLRIIDSAKFLTPADKSPEARAKRTMDFRDFDGIRFLAEVGIEQGKNGFADKNVITRAITKDRAEWAERPPIVQTPPDSGSIGGSAPASAPPPPAAASITKPKWAE